jgi:choline transport protein
VLVNATALVWAAFTWFWMFWPNATPIAPDTFNWAPVMFVGAVVGSVGYYVVKGKKVYVGPVASVRSM